MLASTSENDEVKEGLLKLSDYDRLQPACSREVTYTLIPTTRNLDYTTH